MKSMNPLLAPEDNHAEWTPLLELAAREVFELMLSSQLTVSATAEEPNLEITSMVGLAGQLCGVLSVRCSGKAAALMASKMLGITSTWTFYGQKKLLVAPGFFDHLRKHSLAQPSVKRSLGVRQQLCHCLFMSATRAARLFFWILVNRKNMRRPYCFVNFQQIDLICWPRQR